MTTHGLMYEFWSAARQGPRMYFAPLVGAIRAVRDEIVAPGTTRTSTKADTERAAFPSRKRIR